MWFKMPAIFSKRFYEKYFNYHGLQMKLRKPQLTVEIINFIKNQWSSWVKGIVLEYNLINKNILTWFFRFPSTEFDWFSSASFDSWSILRV